MRNVCICLALLSLTGCITPETDLDVQKNFEAHTKIGLGYLASNNFPAALVEFKIAEEIKPEDPPIHNDLALVYYFRNHMVEAEQELLRALELQPSYSDARNNLGRLYLELGQFQDALKQLQQCEQDLTYNAPEKVHFNLAMTYFKLDRFSDAKSQAQRALNRMPKMCESELVLAESDFQLSHYKDAEREFLTVQTDCKGAFVQEANYYLGLSYFHSGDTVKAKTTLEELIHNDPGSSFTSRAQNALRIIR